MDPSINEQKGQSEFHNTIETSKEEGSEHISTEQLDESDSIKLNPLSENGDVKTEIPSKAVNSPFLYTKRSGTSGIGGQLYETKLLTLLLLRALNHKDISKFYLATNIEGIGAFDDIVLKYETNKEEKPKILFIQAKHKEEPNENKITIHDFFKEYGDFCLHKYFDSYLNIKGKFNRNSNDNIFENTFNKTDCNFIIYTTAIENITEREKIILDNFANPLHLHTSNAGKAFRIAFNDDDVERLLETFSDVQAKLLGKTFMKFIFKENYKPMLTNDLMKIYHVFLAQQVVEIVSNELDNKFLEAKFRDTFLNSKQACQKILKQSIYKEFSLKYPKYSYDQLERVVANFTFKLPHNFGNINFNVGDSTRKSDRRLMYICSKIKRLIDNADASGSPIIRIDDNRVGLGEILQSKDLEICRLGGLVGNLFVSDTETLKLKFSESVESLPPTVVKLFELLKKQYPAGFDFYKYRFDVNAGCFPKIIFARDWHQWTLVKEFLDRLIFYTNEACENDVEKVLKDEITKYCDLHLNKNNQRCGMKCESIFLKVHDTIQKWWKQPNNAAYLDENCTFFIDAKEHLLTYSLLNTLHFIYKTKLIMYDIQFDDETFYYKESEQGFINIVTNNIIFTSIKLNRFLERNNECLTHIFVHLDFVASINCFDEILSQLKEAKPKTIVVACENNNLYNKINNILTITESFVVLVTKNEIREQVPLNIDSIEYKCIRDQKTSFIDLNIENKRKILNETNVIFQGSILPLKRLIKKKFKIIDTDTLFTLLNKENIIKIGKEITNSTYEAFEDSYVQRTIWRFITLEQKPNHNLHIVNEDTEPTIPEDKFDVILISDNEESFIRYCQMYETKNVHWFMKHNQNYVWRMSKGSLNGIHEHVKRNSDESFKYKPKSLFDTDEKVTIVSAEPGMGKSTFMTYLSIQTKLNYPTNWIVRINCLDYKNLLSYWHENNTVIDLKEVIKLLYAASKLLIVNMTKKCTGCFESNVSINICPNGDVCILNNDGEHSGLALLEVELFNYMYNTGQVVVIVDGFDEISPDYLNEVMSLLEILKNSKVNRLWIATRPYNIVNNLEQRLGTFSFSLEKLTMNDQIDLLEKLWGRTVNAKPSELLRFYVEQFSKQIYLILCDYDKDFMSIPLHIYMVAEIYQDFFKSYNDPYIPRLSEEYMRKISDINTLTLYEKFVNIKFYKIHYGEKKPYIYDRDPDMKKMIEKERKDFIKIHKKLAAYTILNKTVKGLFLTEDEHEINDALDQVRRGEVRIGIIDRVVGDELQFVHLTFAEYFTIEYLCDKLKAKECPVDVWIYLLDTIFISDEGIKLRKFFELKLSADKELFKLSENLKYKQEIFNTLIEQRGQSSLSVGLSEYTKKIAMFLLQCVREVLNKDNLSDFVHHITQRKGMSCVFCSIVNAKFKNVLEIVLDLIKSIDASRLLELFTCGDVPMFNALGIAVTYCGLSTENEELLGIMLTSIEDDNSALQLFTLPSNMGLLKNTIIHVLIMNYYSIRLLVKYLLRFTQEQRMKIFSTFDSDGKLAAHFAAQQGDFDFFVVLDSLLDKDNFRIICMTYDNIGRTCFDYLSEKARDPKIFKLTKPFQELYEYNKSENCIRYGRVTK